MFDTGSFTHLIQANHLSLAFSLIANQAHSLFKSTWLPLKQHLAWFLLDRLVRTEGTFWAEEWNGLWNNSEQMMALWAMPAAAIWSCNGGCHRLYYRMTSTMLNLITHRGRLLFICSCKRIINEIIFDGVVGGWVGGSEWGRGGGERVVVSQPAIKGPNVVWKVVCCGSKAARVLNKRQRFAWGYTPSRHPLLSFTPSTRIWQAA